MLYRVVRDVTDGAAGERGHLGYLDVLVDGQLPLEDEHRIALDGLVWPGSDHLERVRAYEAVPGDVLARQDGLEQEAVFRVVGDAQVGDDGRDEIGGELDVHGDAIPALFLEDQAFEVIERGCCRELLRIHRGGMWIYLGLLVEKKKEETSTVNGRPTDRRLLPLPTCSRFVLTI